MIQDESPAVSITSAWDKQTVPLEAIERALYALADRATGTVREQTSDWIVSLVPRSAKVDHVSLAHVLRQEINDQTLRVRIAEKTDSVRNLVFALAFSRSGLVQTSSDE